MNVIKFRRIRSGLYRDETTRWTIERQGDSQARFTRQNWLVKDPAGVVMRVRDTFTEAEMEAHIALNMFA